VIRSSFVLLLGWSILLLGHPVAGIVCLLLGVLMFARVVAMQSLDRRRHHDHLEALAGAETRLLATPYPREPREYSWVTSSSDEKSQL
jgi:hypothetical protein